jgi:hypothetical protein
MEQIRPDRGFAPPRANSLNSRLVAQESFELVSSDNRGPRAEAATALTTQVEMDRWS